MLKYMHKETYQSICTTSPILLTYNLNQTTTLFLLYKERIDEETRPTLKREKKRMLVRDVVSLGMLKTAHDAKTRKDSYAA